MAGYIQESGESIQPMKMFYNGAQLISRGFKEKLQDVFKGTPYVNIFVVFNCIIAILNYQRYRLF